jgi:hypothetical protein
METKESKPAIQRSLFSELDESEQLVFGFLSKEGEQI